MPSSAEPAHPERPEHTTAGPPGNVIRLARRTLRSGYGRRTHRPAASEEKAAAASPQQRLAETAEAWFLARQSTLTAPETADTYRATLDLVQLMLDGTLANELVGDSEHRHLAAMVQGLRDAPDHL